MAWWKLIPGPEAHTQSLIPHRGCCRPQTCLTDFTKILPSGPKKLGEITLCSQDSGAACKHRSKSRPRETLPFASFLGRQHWPRDLVQVLALTGLPSPPQNRGDNMPCPPHQGAVEKSGERCQYKMQARDHYNQTTLL